MAFIYSAIVTKQCAFCMMYCNYLITHQNKLNLMLASRKKYTYMYLKRLSIQSDKWCWFLFANHRIIDMHRQIGFGHIRAYLLSCLNGPGWWCYHFPLLHAVYILNIKYTCNILHLQYYHKQECRTKQCIEA